MAKFTVDTHLFRELGELLVGRDSTALVELIKNSYDADATNISIHGEHLDDPSLGRITITDDGHGMTDKQFELGFLRVASRLKDGGDRCSQIFHRRYTGYKGIGRLAAHKLAKHITVYSIPDDRIFRKGERAVSASIDWDIVESKETLDQLKNTNAITLNTEEKQDGAASGTIIELERLRRKWTSGERARFFGEISTFQVPQVLLDIPKNIVSDAFLIDKPVISDTCDKDPGCQIDLTGDFEAGEEFWLALSQAADWILEIDASRDDQIHYQISPTKKYCQKIPGAKKGSYTMAHPIGKRGPQIQARILIRDGKAKLSKAQRTWMGGKSGIRVYMEGFRVLPYGASGDDWLSIDADYSKRSRKLQFLDVFDSEVEFEEDKDAALIFLPSAAYFGAVFLTQKSAPGLRLLVNREGFVPDASFDSLKTIIRRGIDLSVRQRASAKKEQRADRRKIRGGRGGSRIFAKSRATSTS